jgi:DNA repair ATPase RecN
MLTKVTLTNFQSHKSTTLELGKLNMLTGTSNSGKSAVLRALIGALKNEAATSFVTYGEKALKVELHFDDGNVVEWHKGSGANKYVLRTPEGDVETYDKVGAEVPEAVSSVLGLTPIIMEDGTKLHVNAHAQLDPPFLVTDRDTPGKVAKVFGELTAASKLYSAVSEGNRRNREASSRKKLRRDDLNGVREQLLDYSGLDADLELLAEVEHLTRKATGCSESQTRLSGLRDDYEASSAASLEASTRLSELLPLLELDIEALVQLAARSERLSAFQREANAVAEKVGKLRKLEAPLAAAASVAGLDEALEIARKVERIGTLRATYSGAQSTLAEMLEKQRKLVTASKLIDKALGEAYSELTSCPSCGQELTNDTAKEHLLEGVT